MDDLNDLERGLVAGLLVGEGRFGVDGSRAQVAIGMHVRHEPLLRWPPTLVPRRTLIQPVLRAEVDPHVPRRLEAMSSRSRAYMAGIRAREEGVAFHRAPREKLRLVR